MRLFLCLLTVLFVSSSCFAQGKVTLSWDANTEGDLSHYNVYRADDTTSTSFALVSPTTFTRTVKVVVNSVIRSQSQEYLASGAGLKKITASTYADTDLHVGGYYYYVTAVDVSGNESGPSNKVATIVKDGKAPKNPTRLILVDSGGG